MRSDSESKDLYPKAPEPFEMMTGRQYFILGRIAHGDTVKEIGREMGIEQYSVYCHIRSIRKKFGIEKKSKFAVLFFAYAPREDLLVESPRILTRIQNEKKEKSRRVLKKKVIVSAKKASDAFEKLAKVTGKVKREKIVIVPRGKTGKARSKFLY